MASCSKIVTLVSQTNVLAVPDHHIAKGYWHSQANDSELGLSIKEDSRFIIKAGTVYPSNDDKALGIVLHDYDVTDCDQNIAVITHGEVLTSALKTQPSDEAMKSMNNITFVTKPA